MNPLAVASYIGTLPSHQRHGDMGLWEMIVLVVAIGVLGSLAERYIKYQAKQGGQVGTGELRELIRETVREELEPLREEIQRLEASRRPPQLEQGHPDPSEADQT